MLLAVDTSTRMMGISLITEHDVKSEVMWTTGRYHTVELAPAVEKTLQRIGANSKDLTALGIAQGPGSFTGLRIGMALIKGLAYARQLPIIAVPTLDITAACYPPGEVENLVAVLPAGRSRIAAGWYQAVQGEWVPVGDPENLTEGGLLEKISAPAVLTGEIPDSLRKAAAALEDVSCSSAVQSVRRPAVLASLAWSKWENGAVSEPETLAPLYLSRGDD